MHLLSQTRRRGVATAVLAGLLMVLVPTSATATAFQPTISHPVAGVDVEQGSVTFTGSASASDEVKRVDLSLFQVATGHWLKPDGSFGPGWTRHDAVLASPGSATTDWSFTTDLLPGDYRLGARTRDAAYAGSPNTTVDFTVVDPGAAPPDTTAPGVTIDVPDLPTPGRTVFGHGVLTFAGTATDDVGIDRVRYSVQNQDTGQWLNPDGTWGAWSLLVPSTSGPATAVDWTFDLDLQTDARWLVQLRAWDTSENRTQLPNRYFETVGDQAPPAITIDAPALPAPPSTIDLQSGPLTIVGTATDDVAVDRVRFAVRDQATLQWLQPDGSWGSWTQVDATTSGDPQSLTWQADLDLPEGSWLITVYAWDTSDNRHRLPNRYFTTTDAAPVDPVVTHGGLVPDLPRSDVVRTLGGEVLALDQAGDTIVVGGSFTQIRLPDGTTVAQSRLTAYDADTGLELPGFRPALNGEVRAVRGLSDGSFLVGGTFTTIDGQPHERLARFLPDGSLDPVLDLPISGAVDGIDVADGTVFITGAFTHVGGVARSRVAAIDLASGQVLSSLDSVFSEGISIGGYCNGKTIDANDDATALFVVHSCRKVDGLVRTVAVRFDLVGDSYVVAPWELPIYEEHRLAIGGQIPVRAGAVAPDFSYGVIVTKGGDNPPIADTAVAFPLTGSGPVTPTWITRNFDSTYAVAISDAAVYIGGHFQYTEGPRANDPWPGDAADNYGFGRTEGARVLGGQALRRNQVAALDPATGHALPWNPGANGQQGVLALEVVPDGLLLGHDGATIGSLNIGRHGFFDLDDLPVEPAEPTAVFVNPRIHLDMSAGNVHVSGRATPAADVTRVEFEAFSVQGDTVAADALLEPNVVSGTRAWQLTVPFDGGDWTLRARAHVGGVAGPWVEQAFTVTGTIGDEAPFSSISSPLEEIIAPGPTTWEGGASDDVGVDAVQVTVRNTVTNDYLQPGGGVAPAFAHFPAVLTDTGATSTRWSVEIDVPEGSWRVTARPIDTTGLSPNVSANRVYLVDADAQAPEVAFTGGPTAGELVTDRTPTFEVTGTDDRDLRRVDVHLRQWIPESIYWEVPTGLFLAGQNEFFPAPGFVDTGTGGTATFTTPELPFGRWEVEVRGVDDQGLESELQSLQFVVGMDSDAAPVADVTSVTYDQSDFTTLEIPIAGTASDDNAVAAVKIAVAGEGIAPDGSDLWLQADGTFGPTKQLVPLVITPDTGAMLVTFDTTVAVPVEATYRITVYPFDDVGQPNSELRWDKESVEVHVYPSDPAPTVILDSPVEGQSLTGTSISAHGDAEDDSLLETVEILVRNRDTGQGPRRDGTIGNPEWVTVSHIANPDQDRTVWSHNSIDLPAGPYSVRVRSRDNHQQLSDLVIVNVTLAP